MNTKSFLIVATLTITLLTSSAHALYVPCVSEICGGAGLNSPFYGFNIAPSSSSFILRDISQAYPWVWQPLFPFSYPGAYNYWSSLAWLLSFF
jgi:hypothetical protein